MILVPGEGPVPCAVMLVGEYPGVDELKYGRPFVGKAGRELRRFLNGYTCPEADTLYLTNLKKSPPEGKEYVLSDEERAEFARELDTVAPQVIVALGAHVMKFLMGDEWTMEACHGIPHPALHGAYTVFPCYNPAAGLHSPQLQTLFAYDMKRLGLYLQGTLPAPAQDMAGRYYNLYTSDQTALSWPDLDPNDYRRPLAHLEGVMGAGDYGVDTEGLPARPWCASFSQTPGYGHVVLAKDMSAFTARVLHLAKQDAISLTLHNALHDLAVLREMGLDLDAFDIPFDDTMVMAYLLGIEPQGLKALGYRHAGAEHDDYMDIVAEPSQALAITWLVELIARLPTVPAKPTRKKELALWAPPDPTDAELDKVRKLLDRMLAKSPDGLRKRWADSRSREILVDELGYLPSHDADPPEASLDDVPLQTAVNYAARDADLTVRVKRALRPQITAMGLDDVYAVDIAIVPMVDRMQAVGIDVDLAHFKNVSAMLAVEIAMNAEAIEQRCGRKLNPHSGDQVAELLFDELRLHEQAPNLRLKYTKSHERFSTNDKVLEAMESLDPIVTLITEGRELGKLKGTYADTIPYLIGRDGRLHPRYRLTRTATGRLSAADPNMLALPKHTLRGKLIRQGFRPGPGRVFSEFDYSQIEMVEFADSSQDEGMLAAIRNGLDLHRDTASTVIFNKASGEIDDDERFAAKAVNFGILMGITEFGLLDQLHKNGQLHWTLDMTADLLRQWHRGRPGGSRYIDRKHAEARQYGYVRDRWGRLRWLEGIHSYDKYIAAEAERQAQATPTQSGAQGIMKRAMRDLWPILKQLRAQGMWIDCLLQWHDALIFEHDEKDAAFLEALITAVMVNAVTLSVPIHVKAKLNAHHLGEF